MVMGILIFKHIGVENYRKSCKLFVGKVFKDRIKVVTLYTGKSICLSGVIKNVPSVTGVDKDKTAHN